MKKKKNIFCKNWYKICDLLSYVITIVIPIIVAAILLNNNYISTAIMKSKFVTSESFESLCYTMVIFILGIIISLKLKILDHKESYRPIFINVFRKLNDKGQTVKNNIKFRKNEAVAFGLFVFSNALYLFCAFLYSCIGENVISVLLAFISFDFVVMVRNIFILGRIYRDDIFKKNKSYVNLGSLKIDRNKVEVEMHHLEKILDYKFDNIEYLEKAMYAKNISLNKKNDEHSNHALATFGDSILKAILSQNLYEEGKNRDEITSDKSKLENNKVLYRIVNDVDTPIINFAFHDSSFYKDQTNEEKVSNSTHSQYLEAIVAAIYLDSSFEKARIWVNDWLLPKMKKYEKNND